MGGIDRVRGQMPTEILRTVLLLSNGQTSLAEGTLQPGDAVQTSIQYPRGTRVPALWGR